LKNAKWLAILTAVLVLPLLVGSGAWAQNESSARGNLSGVVLDATKATVPGAQITINGPIGNLSQTTNDQGTFLFSTLIPGFYSIKVQKAGFKVASVPATEVLINKTTSVEVVLETGEITQTVEVSAATVTVDTSASAVNSEFSDSFYNKIPLGRGVSSLFYLAPGVTSGLGTGQENPSISGSTGLENLYVADGVSINDPAFGGIGVWSRVYGALGTGINLSFVKEVQIKTGGFEPQYGHVSGGIVQLVTKSGGTKFFGTAGGYFNSRWMQDTYQNSDDPKFARTNKVGSRLENADYEGDFELGGYVPLHGLKDRLFFFGTFNPSWNHAYFQPVIGSGLFTSNPLIDRYTTRYDYAGKLTFKINNSHTVESTVSGDPSHTNPTAFSTLNADNNSGNSKWEYGTRNWATRYDGAIGSSLLVDGAFTWGWNRFKETAQFPNVYNVVDNTQIATGQRGSFNASGVGTLEPYDGDTRSLLGDITKTVRFAGTHSINIGYNWQYARYTDHTYYAGPRFVLPSTNATGGAPGRKSYLDFAAGNTSDIALELNLLKDIAAQKGAPCALCPYDLIPQADGSSAYEQVVLQQTRGRFDGGFTKSSGKYHAGYINDAWTISKYVTLNAGVRWEQQRLTGNLESHTFVNMWSPRVGITVDPTGTRKQKFYANFGRYAYVLPLDQALRSLSNENDLSHTFWQPVSGPCPATANLPAGALCVIKNSLGTVDFVGDSAHFLNKAKDPVTGQLLGINRNASFFSSGQNIEPFATGTRMEFTDEFLVGYDREFKGGVVASVRYIDRRLKRIIEDQSGSSVEQNNAGLPLFYVIGNPNASQDIFVNPNEIVFSQGKPFNTPCATGTGVGAVPCQQLDITVPANAQAYINAGFPAACFDTNSNVTPNFVFDQFSGFAASTNGPPNGSACFPAVNTKTWTDAKGNLLPDCTSLAQSKLPITDPNACAAFGSEFYADGKPDTYKDPKREYEAVEFEVRKAFTHNWALSVNYRIAQLRGNYEGAFRNDNGQADPGISSLFDFTEGQLGLLNNQQSIGPLNSDRKHTFNAHATYVLPNGKLKGFTIGGGVSILSGNPLTTFYAQEPYVNQGEVPQFGRGDLGRAPVVGSVDAHLEYPFKITERLNLKVAFDLFNIVDSTRKTTVDQNGDLGFGTTNVDFSKPVSNNGLVTPANFISQGFVDPFSSRLTVLLTW